MNGRFLSRNKKSEDATVDKGPKKGRGFLKKLGLGKKSKAEPVAEPVEEKPAEEKPAEETPAPTEEEHGAGPAEPETEEAKPGDAPEEKTDEEKPDSEGRELATEEDKEEGEDAEEQPESSDPPADKEAAVDEDEADDAEVEEREQPEAPGTPKNVQNTGFLCGCIWWVRGKCADIVPLLMPQQEHGPCPQRVDLFWQLFPCWSASILQNTYHTLSCLPFAHVW